LKKLLIIAPYFLPRRRVGALRPYKFAIHLRDYGWNPHVLTIASDGQLTPKEQKLLQDISVYNLKPPFDRTGGSGGQRTKLNNIKQENNFIADWIDKHFPVDTWLPFFRFKFGEIKQIASKVNPDAFWSTGDPWSAHWVGKKLSSLYPDTFWMADFRDPWTVSETNLKKRSVFASAVDRKMERNWIQKASMLSFTTKSTRELYEEHYSELNIKTTTIYNAFDRELFNTGGEKAVDLNFDAEKLNIIFFGRFRRLSTAKPIIDILSELKSIAPSAVEKISVHSFGPLTDSDRIYLSEKGVENCFEIQEPVPVEQGLQVLQQADILFLSTNPGRTAIIPAKLWDYLAAERPILSIAPNPEIEQILKQTGSGVQYSSQNPKEVAELLKRCVTGKENGQDLPIPFALDKSKIGQYSAKSATAKLANILDQHTG
jgi:glycosyltransferase involved in cell wall biosynthesis